MIEQQRTLDVEALAIGSLKPYPRNPRTHSEKQINQIANSIRQFGFTNPVLIDSDLGVIAGHGRIEAAKLLGACFLVGLERGAGSAAEGGGCWAASVLSKISISVSHSAICLRWNW